MEQCPRRARETGYQRFIVPWNREQRRVLLLAVMMPLAVKPGIVHGPRSCGKRPRPPRQGARKKNKPQLISRFVRALGTGCLTQLRVASSHVSPPPCYFNLVYHLGTHLWHKDSQLVHYKYYVVWLCLLIFTHLHA